MKIVINFMAAAVIVVIIAIFLAPSAGSPESAYHAAVRNDMKQICLAVRFIHEKTGKFPESLQDLPIQLIEKEILWFYDPKSSRPYDWIYKGRELNRNGYEHDSVLLVSPTTFGYGADLPEEGKEKYRFVGYVNCYVESMTESDYQALRVEPVSIVNDEAAPHRD